MITPIAPIMKKTMFDVQSLVSEQNLQGIYCSIHSLGHRGCILQERVSVR